ncbi:MAG: CBM96 family carbohydrate-binding protein [Anaerolineales bacterium]
MQSKNFYRFVNLLLVVLLALSANAVVHASTRAAVVKAPTLTFNPSADAYVISTYASSNFGTATNLRVDSSPVTRSYLRFTVSGVGAGTVQSAVLRIYANSANTTGFAVHSVADNTWTESGITYTNSPAIGSVISSSTAFSAGAWVAVNITSYIKADGTYNLAIDTSNTTNTSLGSREAGANAPQLLVTLAGTGGATSTPTAGSTSAATNTPAATATPGGSGTVTFKPSADSYVISTSASSNFGTATNLRVDSSPVTRSYMRFVVSSLPGAVQSATLRIYANSANTTGFAVHSVADNTWTETGINYTNSPAVGALIKNSAAFNAAAWVAVDVTSYIKAAGTYNLEIDSTNSTNTSLGSREAGANAPQLVVTTGGSGGPTSTPVPTLAATNTKVPTTPPTATSPITATNTPVKTATNTPVVTATKTSVPIATSTVSSTCSPVILTKGPTLIFTGDNTKMRVFWQWTSNATFQMEWGTSTSYSSGNVAVTAKNTTNHLYQYDISGLTPGTKYYYEVVAGSQCSGGTFYAAPASNATSLKFTAYGDSRTNGSVHNGIAGQIDALFASDPAFQTLNLSVGDWVSSDSDSAWMSEWFATAYTSLRKQDANLADIGIRGNHEGSATFWKQYWPEPFQSGGLYWSFDYGPIHVDMLDAYTSYSAGSAQYNWLKADLAATTKTWKVVMIHEPGWSAGGGHSNNTTVQTDLQPLLVQYGVAMLLSGHNHYYARAMVNGVVELTVGGGGAPLYTPASGQPNIVTYTKAYSFAEFTISGNTLTAKVVNNSGVTIDTFTITK